MKTKKKKRLQCKVLHSEVNISINLFPILVLIYVQIPLVNNNNHDSNRNTSSDQYYCCDIAFSTSS